MLALLRRVLFPGTLLLLTTLAQAEAPRLSLADAIETALLQNHRLAAADAGVLESEAVVEEARSGRLPQLGADVNFSRTTNPTLVFSNKLGQEQFTGADFDPNRLNNPDPLNNFQGSISVYQPIYAGGATRGGIDAALARQSATLSGRERTRQEVVQGVIAAYADAVLADHQMDVAQGSLETARANVKLVSDQHEAGLVVASDLLQARVRETEVLELVARAESAVELSRARLNMAMGQDLDGSWSLTEPLEVEDYPLETIADLTEEALYNRPDLEAGRASLLAAGESVRSARSGYLPEIGVRGTAEANAEQLSGAYGSNWSVFVGARFSLFDGKRTRARVRQAGQRTNRARRELLLLEQAVELEVRQAFYDRRTAAKRLDQTRSAIEMARESLRIVQDRYAEGLATLLDLLESETGLTRALHRDVAARRDLLLAQARLDLAAGRH